MGGTSVLGGWDLVFWVGGTSVLGGWDLVFWVGLSVLGGRDLMFWVGLKARSTLSGAAQNGQCMTSKYRESHSKA